MCLLLCGDCSDSPSASMNNHEHRHLFERKFWGDAKLKRKAKSTLYETPIDYPEPPIVDAVPQNSSILLTCLYNTYLEPGSFIVCRTSLHPEIFHFLRTTFSYKTTYFISFCKIIIDMIYSNILFIY